MGTTATVLGASGYAGGELLRLLLNHPALTPRAAAGLTRSGDEAGEVLPHLTGAGIGRLVAIDEAARIEADVCFSALPSGTLDVFDVGAEVIVDLSDDHRAHPDWAYGLPELHRSAVQGAGRVANPGCYPTAALLCLAPFFAAHLVTGPVIIDALSGLSGAGRRGEDRLAFATASDNAGAYGTVDHRHRAEIERGLALVAGEEVAVSFTPHLAPMSRGLLVTARAGLAAPLTDEDALEVLEERYASEPFVHVVSEWPSTKAVAGTNRAHVSARIDQHTGYLIASAAIDNLGKGAAGQAIQNANLCLGFAETAGLESWGTWP